MFARKTYLLQKISFILFLVSSSLKQKQQFKHLPMFQKKAKTNSSASALTQNTNKINPMLTLKKIAKFATIAGVSAMTVTTLFPNLALANLWAGNEKGGSCYIPNRQTSFNCQFGPYRTEKDAKQIGGFYVNPRHQFGKGGTIPFEYKVNGGGWQSRRLVLNSTSANYIDFGNGVQNFEFRFRRPESDELGGGSTINFRMNYDLDR